MTFITKATRQKWAESERAVRFDFDSFIQGLPENESISWGTMSLFAENLLKDHPQYRFDPCFAGGGGDEESALDDCCVVCMVEAQKLMGQGWLEPDGPMFIDGYQVHDDYIRTAKPSPEALHATLHASQEAARVQRLARGLDIAGRPIKS